jgi:two-component system cell cycle sensor histidine kinase/response regulator CckA
LVRGNRPIGPTNVTVLVVDDEDVVRRVTSSVLRRLGYTVVEAASGSEGVRLAQEHAGKLHLLLTDMTMADVTGSEVGVAFQQANPQRPMIFSSGYGTADMLEAARKGGAFFLEKPYDVNRLAKMVEDALAAIPQRHKEALE